RDQILKSRIQKHHFVNRSSRLLLFGQLSGALGGFLLAYAISLNNPAIINALAGVQYIFVLLGVLLLSKKLQHLLEENLTSRAIRQKILGATVICLGLGILALS
ncbi:MAG: hypothetical protein Q7S88_00525, partial [Candidatus Daviesbacteria bacterium]|nr:hypothetical protein [Candidatus Daviesbacteria bacterium]